MMYIKSGKILEHKVAIFVHFLPLAGDGLHVISRSGAYRHRLHLE